MLGLFKLLFGGLGGITKTVGDYFTKRGQRQTSIDVASIESTKDSWKDEVISIIVLFPIILLMFATTFGILVIMFSKDIPAANKSDKMIEAVLNSITTIGSFPDWYQHLIYIVVTAGIGLYVLAKNSKRKNKHNGNNGHQDETQNALRGFKNG